MTYTATFSGPMTVTPTVDINGQGYQTLTHVSGDTVWSYFIDMSTYTGPEGAVSVAVSGTDKFEIHMLLGQKHFLLRLTLLLQT